MVLKFVALKINIKIFFSVDSFLTFNRVFKNYLIKED